MCVAFCFAVKFGEEVCRNGVSDHTPPGFLTQIFMSSPSPLWTLANTAAKDFLIFFLLLVRNEVITSPLLPPFPLHTSMTNSVTLWQYLNSGTVFFLSNNQLLSVNSNDGCLIYVSLDNKVQ